MLKITTAKSLNVNVSNFHSLSTTYEKSRKGCTSHRPKHGCLYDEADEEHDTSYKHCAHQHDCKLRI